MYTKCLVSYMMPTEFLLSEETLAIFQCPLYS